MNRHTASMKLPLGGLTLIFAYTLLIESQDVEHFEYDHIPKIFALIRKDFKYFYWPQIKYEQLFNIEKDAYDEYDVINSTAQTTQNALDVMKARYEFQKRWAQSGKPV